MPTPRIGLTSYRESAQWGVWHAPADLVPTSYSDAVRRAGGAPMLLPPGGSVAEAETVLGGLDGLVLTGGADVDPARYAASRDEHTGSARADRDEWELALIAAALAAGRPIFGICRGLQVLNVAFGGTLIQHLPDLVGTDEHRPTVGAHGTHEVRIADSGLVAAAMSGPRVSVATYHHQAIARLADDLVASAWADDGTIEAIERRGAPWTVGVQWHPEVAGADALFDDFVLACAQESRRPSGAGGTRG